MAPLRQAVEASKCLHLGQALELDPEGGPAKRPFLHRKRWCERPGSHWFVQYIWDLLWFTSLAGIRLG